MEKVLFVNACMRGKEISRTYRLCKVFLDGYIKDHPSTIVQEVDLTREKIPCYYLEDINHRDSLIDDDKLHDKMFDHAKQFASADKIIIGAPYWDLSFPSALKAYIEHISVRNITFRIVPDGVEGLCVAEKLMYITTVGGYIKGVNHGSDYFKGLCGFFGIKQFDSFYAEGLDIESEDPVAIMTDAEVLASQASKLY